MVEQGNSEMDEKTVKEVATLHRQIEALKDQLAEAHALNTVLLGQLGNKGVDPDHLAA